MSDNKIQEVFGQFAVDLGEGPVLFKTEGEAQVALSEYENGAEQRQLAADFCAHVGIEAGSKNAKGKANVITAFLSWVDAGQPGPVPAEGEGDAAEASTEGEAEAETTF